MSHANGEVIQDGKVIAYFEYNGTVDVCRSQLWFQTSPLFYSQEDLQENWRGPQPEYKLCEHPKTDVILYADYGYGFHWNGKVCLQCGRIVEGHDPYESDTTTHGHPLK